MVTPRKSPVDPSNYRLITLPNGFKALLVTTCDYEPPEKKCAYTEKSKRCSLKPSPSCDQKAKQFNRKFLLAATKQPVAAPTLNLGASLLENVALLSTTKLNPLFGHSEDAPVEEFEEDCTESFPPLTEKQQAQRCRDTRKYDMMACMSLCIGAGYFHDPPNLKGAAHLLEHVFLTGCSKYPDSRYFDEFLEFTGGSPWNGNTDGCRTVYYLDTSSDYISDTLDILAAHIKSPSLTLESIQHERETIDAEFRKAIPVETFRFNQFLQSLSTPGHPYHTFSWGNAESLGKGNCDAQVRRTLVQFFEDNYTTDNMFFAIQAPETLRKLENLVREAFSSIDTCERKSRMELTQFPMPFCNDRFLKLYKIAAVSNTRKLIITWQLPSMSWKAYDVKPINYIAHVLLNENAGGLAHYLVHSGLIREAMTNPTESNMERSDACAIFSLHFTLTKSGLDNYMEILRAVFAYIRLMVEDGPQYGIFLELVRISAMQFHYLRESDQTLRVKELSEAMRVYKAEDVISGPVLMRSYDPDLITRITAMLRPEEANFILCAKEFEGECDQRERYFGIQFKEIDFDCEHMKQLKSIKPYNSFKFSQPNPFITTDYCLVQPTVPSDIELMFPEKIIHPEFPEDKQPVHLWFFQLDNLVIPQANYLITINSPVVMESALNTVMLDIFTVLLRDHLRGHCYSANVAMLQVDIQSTHKGLQLSLAGFSQKLPLLLQQLLSTLAQVRDNTSQVTFENARLVVLEEYENSLLEPCSLSSDMRKAILYEQYWDLPCRFSTCKHDCNFDAFNAFAEDLQQRLHIRAYVGGNINRELAHEIVALFPAIFDYEAVSCDRFPKSRVHLLPSGESCLRLRSYSTEGDTTIVKNIYQLGRADYKTRIIADYILELMAEPLFHVLRTEKGLSYNPDVIIHEDFGVLTLQIHLICSAERHEPHVINAEVDDFLKNFYNQSVLTLRDSQLDKLRKEMIEAKLSHITSPADCEEMWEGIIERDLDFAFLLYEIQEWKSLKVQDIKSLFQKCLLRPDYRKVSIQIAGHKKKKTPIKSTTPDYSHLQYLGRGKNEDACNIANFIADIKRFKRSLLSFPAEF